MITNSLEKIDYTALLPEELLENILLIAGNPRAVEINKHFRAAQRLANQEWLRVLLNQPTIARSCKFFTPFAMTDQQCSSRIKMIYTKFMEGGKIQSTSLPSPKQLVQLVAMEETRITAIMHSIPVLRAASPPIRENT